MQDNDENKLDLEIKEDDIKEVLGIFERVPPFLLKIAISKNMNAVKSFGGQIEEYKGRLTIEHREKIRKVMEMPVPELQKLLDEIYLKTNCKQFKILAQSKSAAFLELNLCEFEKVLFNE